MTDKPEQATKAQDLWDGEVEFRRLVQAAKRSPRQSESLAELPDLVGTAIGPWHLRSILGNGGMGIVYAAEQSEPLRRKVALKVIKPGMDSREVIRCFQSERQSLAMMDHPHIASVIDAGATDTGLPFFVMELIRGVSITRYFDDQNLTVSARLDLFQQVCLAVQHAHQKGIIHRDLKPSNIMVTVLDGVPVPKVIDFGLAKAIDQRLSGETVFTRATQLVGTPMYMSPEQSELSGIDIDTRSDIYSLGVLLYELLTGSTPFSRQQLEQLSFDEIRRKIREVDPPRPSDRLRSLDAETLSVVAARRSTPSGRLIQNVRGDLDWIVMKTLDKDRTRRYQTPFELAEDLNRHLNDEPVKASPPTRAYRIKKFTRKNRVALLVAGLPTGILLAGIAGTSVGWFKSLEAERLSNQRLRETERARKDEKLAKENAIASAKRSGDVLQIVIKSFRSTDPRQGSNDGMEAKEVLFNALKSVETSDLDNKGKMALLFALGLTFQGIGEYDAAVSVGQRDLALRKEKHGPDHPLTLKSMGNLANSYILAGRTHEAVELSEKVVALMTEKLGPDHPDTMNSMNGLASSYDDAGRLHEALKLREKLLALATEKLGPDHPNTLASMSGLAASYDEAGRTQEALELNEDLFALRTKKLGPDHLDMLASMQNLANRHARAGRTNDALELTEKAIARLTETVGVNHLNTLIAMHNLADFYAHAGRTSEALELREKVFALMTETLGPDHFYTLHSIGSLAKSYYAVGRTAEALERFEQVLTRRTEKLGPDHPDTIESVNATTWAKVARKPEGDVLPISTDDLAQIRSVGQKRPKGKYFMTQGVAEFRMGNFEAAIAAAKQSMEITPQEMNLPSEHPLAHAIVAMSHLKLGNSDMANMHRERLDEVMKQDAFKEDRECLSFVEEVNTMFASTGDNSKEPG